MSYCTCVDNDYCQIHGPKGTGLGSRLMATIRVFVPEEKDDLVMILNSVGSWNDEKRKGIAKKVLDASKIIDKNIGVHSCHDDPDVVELVNAASAYMNDQRIEHWEQLRIALSKFKVKP